MSAISGLGIDNCYVEIDSREVPIMDGSAAAFVEVIDEVGIRELSQPHKYIKVLKPIRVDDGAVARRLLCWRARDFEDHLALCSIAPHRARRRGRLRPI